MASSCHASVERLSAREADPFQHAGSHAFFAMVFKTLHESAGLDHRGETAREQPQGGANCSAAHEQLGSALQPHDLFHFGHQALLVGQSEPVQISLSRIDAMARRH